MEMTRKIEIKFNWWNDSIKEKQADFDVQNQLEGEAEERIHQMRAEGYTSGELNSEINGVEYQGWFEISYV